MENSKYRAFITSADLGSFTKAADFLGYTPSGISQLVTSFEQEMGFPLFLRTRKGVVLTENGHRISTVVKEIMKQEDRLAEVSSEINGLETGIVTIATYSSISSHWLPSVIKEFKELYPNIDIHLMEGIRQEVDLWLTEKKADLAFFSYKEGMNYEWYPLAKDNMLAVLPNDHPLAGEHSYPISYCQKEDFIMPALGKDDDVIELLNRHHLTPKIIFSTVENFAALTLIEQGLGISIMNELITKRWVCNVKKLPLNPPEHIILGLAIESLAIASPAVKKFVDLALKRLTSPDN